MRKTFTLVLIFLSAATFAQAPDENRFQKVVLTENLNEPLEMAILPDERVLFIERHGAVKLYNPLLKKTSLIATIPVSTKYSDNSEAEDGLLGVNIDPNFSKNHWIYMYYSPAGATPENILARFEMKGNTLDLGSKKVILRIPVQRDNCCHTGGSIDWDAQGNLYLSTGDNTSPRASDGYAPIDERPGHSPFDAQKSSSNTADLRGKIIRIHPEADGAAGAAPYTIPEGNLFPKGEGNSKTRPEIYTMGHRNPYRISVDKNSGYLYWGDVGPDAGRDSIGLGPAAEDEFGQARKAGNYGWPYFVGDNKAFWEYDFETKKSGEKFNPEKPINNSPNNTGLTELPAAQKAFIWYPAAETKRFPLLGSGGRSAMAGPVFYAENFKDAKRLFPAYYEKKLFLYEWMRDWIMVVTLSPKGDYVKMERFLPNLKLEHPIDMAFGPNGDLYMLEYGQGWFMGNPESKLVRIEFNAGNRKPFVTAAADKLAGAVPFTVQLSSAGTKDFDNDSLQYQWKISSQAGGVPVILTEPSPAYTFRKKGIYKILLTVTDKKGLKDSQSLTVQAGNDPPQVSLELTGGNKSFFFPGKSIQYKVNVADTEDGSLENQKIAASKVKITAAYQDAEDKPKTEMGHQEAPVTFTAGRTLIEKSDCKACHFQDKKSIGPSFKDVSAKYKADNGAVASLSDKIIKGGAGVWGETAMSAHPAIGLPEAGQMVKYILSLGSESAPAEMLKPSGEVIAKVPDGADSGKGIFKFVASYKDNGANGMPPQTTEKTLVLKSPTVLFGSADDASKNVMRFKMGENNLLIITQTNSSATFKNIDLTDITELSMVVAAPKDQLNAQGGVVEVHKGSADGELLGKTDFIEPSNDAAALTGGGTPPKPHNVPIPPQTGMHDLYFVFKNDNAKGALFVPFSVTFLSK